MHLSISPALNSNAFNFLSFISSGVDPRTGTYTCSISMSKLLGNALAGPALPLALSYNALSGTEVGFGRGWLLTLTRYDSVTGKLSLSNGASYEALVSENAFVITDKRVTDIQTRRVGDNLFVEHTSGMLEVLTGPGSDGREWLLTAVYSAEGHKLSLQHDTYAGRSYLKELSDEQQRLLFIEPGETPLITLWPDSLTRQLRFQLHLLNGGLSSIRAVAGNEPLASWFFEYLSVEGLSLISKVQLPSGGREWIDYRASVLKLPFDAPIAALPAVIRHTVVPRLDQPMVIREYDYSLHNYLGYGSSAPWQPTGDNLYQAQGDYEYSSVESLKTGTGDDDFVIRWTERTYNRFHLLVTEETNQNGHVVSTHTEYHQRPGLTIEEQPANFQLPRLQTTSYYQTAAADQVRSETTLTEFDEHGNMVKKVLPTRVTERFEYYPASGDDGCPADPFGVVRWLRSKVVVPASNLGAAQVISTHYRYVQLPGASPERKHFIALQEESARIDSSPVPGEAGVTYRTLKWEYVQHQGSVFHGRVMRKVERINSVDTVFDYRYEQTGSVLHTHTKMSCLGVESNKSVEHDALSGEEVALIDASGVRIETAHDALGRTISETLSPGTPNQVQRRFEHRLANTPDDISVNVTIGVNGARSLTRLDGMSREISKQGEDTDQPGGPLRDVYEAVYDELNQLVEERRTDWLDGVPLKLNTRYLYDDWGNRCASIGPDGITHHDQMDPVSLKRTQWTEGAGRTVVVTNAFNKDESVERVQLDGTSRGVTLYTYDGLGRCISRTDPRGMVTGYTYDFANRLLQTVLPDETVVSRRLIAHATEDLVSRIEVDGYVVGERQFDGLLRVSQVTTGGRTERFEYHQALPNPRTHTKASGTVLSYEYDPQLNNQTLRREVSGNTDLLATYGYEPAFGQLTDASTSTSQQLRSHALSGQLQSEVTWQEGKQYEAVQRSSMHGRSLAYTDVAGVQRVTRYDTSGRAMKVLQGGVEATFEYNSQGLVSRIHAVDLQREQAFTTLLEYDDFGHEVRRLLTPTNAEPELIEQRFDSTQKLIQRTLSRTGVTVRAERYGYDARGRLTTYDCEGTDPPQDFYGHAIRSQVYTFDALDNIRELTTEFAGSQNVTTFRYDLADKTQLSQVEHSHPDYADASMTFEYDLDGHQLNDHQGRHLAYDALGRLSAVQEVRA